MEKGSVPRRVALMVLGAFALASLGLVKCPPSLTTRRNSRAFALLILLAFASILWADDKALSFRRASEFLLMCLGAFAVARRYNLRDVLRLAFAGTLIYLTGVVPWGETNS